MKSRITKVLFISLLFSAKIFPATEMDEAEHPPLIVAIFENKTVEEIKSLVKNNASVSEKCIHGFSALMAAAEDGRLDVVRFLLEKNVNVNEKTTDGYSALHFARNQKIRAVLEENNAKPYIVAANIDLEELESSTFAAARLLSFITVSKDLKK